jgi:hypothetical protein
MVALALLNMEPNPTLMPARLLPMPRLALLNPPPRLPPSPPPPRLPMPPLPPMGITTGPLP